MQCYIYSCQDLVLKGNNNTSAHLKAGDIYCIDFDKDENIFIYSPFQSGVMLINEQTPINKSHNQINFYELTDNNILCEIKPFQSACKHFFYINKTTIKIVEAGGLHIYFNNNYCGKFECGDESPTFEKISQNDRMYGLIKFEKHKYLIFFNESEILYCGKYLDYEIVNSYIQIYEHLPNMFNIGKLVKYFFTTNEFSVRCVNDRKVLFDEKNADFKLECFMEALKCGRYKYAYNQLSYELRADISLDMLIQYFKSFDEYKYIDKANTYITFNNHKIVGVYKFEINQNVIENIY